MKFIIKINQKKGHKSSTLYICSLNIVQNNHRSGYDALIFSSLKDIRTSIFQLNRGHYRFSHNWWECKVEIKR